jgi:hypothetical protein
MYAYVSRGFLANAPSSSLRVICHARLIVLDINKASENPSQPDVLLPLLRPSMSMARGGEIGDGTAACRSRVREGPLRHKPVCILLSERVFPRQVHPCARAGE